VNSRSQLVPVVFLLWEKKLSLAAILTLGFVAGLGSSYLVEKTYLAEVVVLPILDNSAAIGASGSQLGSLASLVGIGGEGVSKKDEALARIESRKFIGEFLAEQDLLPELFREDWDTDQQQWVELPAPHLSDGIHRFLRENLRVSESARQGTITVGLEWHDPERASALVNSLVRKLDGDMRTEAIGEAERSLDFLSSLLTKETAVGLRQSIYQLMEAQLERRMLAMVGDGYVLRVIDPALTPLEKDRVWPKRSLMAALGAIAAFATFLLWLSVRGLVAAEKRSKS